MRRHHHRTTAPRDREEQPHDPVGRHGIEVSRRFVGQQQAGLVEQGAGDHQALLLSARKLERHFVVLGFQPDQLQYFVDTASDFRFGSPACGPHHVVEVLEHVAVGQQLIVLEDDADLPAQIGYLPAAQFPQIETHDAPFADQELDIRIQCFQQGTLPAPHAADQIDELALFDREVDLRKYQLARAHQPFGRLPAERIFGMIDRDVPQLDNAFSAHKQLP